MLHRADEAAAEREHAEEGTARLHWTRQPFHSPKLHQMIVDAALSGARAIAAYDNGRLSTVRILVG